MVIHRRAGRNRAQSDGTPTTAGRRVEGTKRTTRVYLVVVRPCDDQLQARSSAFERPCEIAR